MTEIHNDNDNVLRDNNQEQSNQERRDEMLETRTKNYIDAFEEIPEGRRDKTLHKMGLLLRKNFGLTGDDLVRWLIYANLTKCAMPLSETDVKRIVRSVDTSDVPLGEDNDGIDSSLKRSKTVRQYAVKVAETPIAVDIQLAKEICIYQNCRAKTPSAVLTVGKVLEAFRTGGRSKKLIEAIRNETDKDKRSKLKEDLIAVVFSSAQQTERNSVACTPNGIICFDCDNIPEDELEMAKQAIAAIPYVFVVGLSVSKTGLFALAVYEGTPDLKTLLAAIQTDFPYELDKSCSDISRLRFVTHDPDMIVKDEVFPVTLIEQIEPMDSIGENQEVPPEKFGIDVLDSFLQQIEQISFPKPSGQIKHNVYYIPGIDHLLETARDHQWDIGMKNEAPHFFTGAFWQRVDPQSFRYFLQLAGKKQGMPYNVIKDHLFVDKLEKQFASEARFPVLTVSDTPKINLLNGTLHLTTNGTELKPFDKQDGLTYQLHYDFDESATAPLFKRFFDRVLPDVALQKLVFQYIGYVFLRNMKLEKILFLYGNGANGKSVFLNIIRALIGIAQCCEFSLEGITKAETQRAELGKYLFNVSTEISTRMSTEVFKKIASREPLQARYLYKQPFTMPDYATSVFAMNELPRDVEQTDAFFRRFMLIPFNVRIPDDEQDPDLAMKIIDGEMSGVLNLVIDGMKSLIADQQFDIPDSVREAVEKFRHEADSVMTYLTECRYCRSFAKWIPLQSMYDNYREVCTGDGGKPVSKRTFAKRLRDLGYTVEPHGKSKQVVVFVEREE